MSAAEFSLAATRRKLEQLSGREKMAELKRLQKRRAAAGEQLRRHYNEKIRWLKKRIVEILKERESLLRKKFSPVKLAGIEAKQRAYEREISLLKKRKEAW